MNPAGTPGEALYLKKLEHAQSVSIAIQYFVPLVTVVAGRYADAHPPATEANVPVCASRFSGRLLPLL